MASNETRTFEIKQATRERVPLMIGLVGPSGSGKTYSALRLATGIQRVTGGDICVIDTEARRALHYADRFNFRHMVFGAPFSPLDYLDAVEAAVKAGASVIVIDSMSHEHEGPGGVLEWHDAEAERLSKAWNTSRDAVNFPAWSEPKKARRRMINTLLQLPVSVIFCFRAKEKAKPGKDENGKKTLLSQGWMPIAGEELIYEMTINCLLEPASGGIPTWDPGKDAPGSREIIKLPDQFKALFSKPEPLSEATGEALANWAAGTKPVPRFRGNAKGEWTGRPLADAPVAVLRTYRDAIATAIDKATGSRAAELHAHLGDVDAALASMVFPENDGEAAAQ